MPMPCRVLLCLFAVVSISANLFAQDAWPEFRGPSGDGIATVKAVPLTWSETERVKFKVPLDGKAWSSPVVGDGRIWLTNAPANGKEMRVLAFDLNSGKKLHDIQLWTIDKPQFCHDMNSYASATPVLSGKRLYVHFGVHGTAAIDTTTGAVLWKRPPFDPELLCDHHRGPASSPIIHQGRMFLTFDGFDVQYVAALDTQTGKTLWKRDRKIDYGSDNGDVKKAYATPRVITVDGRDQLVSPSAGALIAYDPAAGTELWRVKCGGMNVSIRPLWSDGLLYCNTAAGGLQLFAVKPQGTGDLTGQVVWKQAKGAAKRSNPLLYEGKIYSATDDGILSCTDARTGDSLWTQRIGGTFAASPVFAAGGIYFFDIEGKSTVIAPGGSYQSLAVNKLSAGCMASPAVVEGALIVRTKEALYRLQE